MFINWFKKMNKNNEKISLIEKLSKSNYVFGEEFIRTFGGGFLDSNNILWKVRDGKFIGKRSVWCFDFRSCWLEDTTIENVKSWWCGNKDVDYTDIFYTY